MGILDCNPAALKAFVADAKRLCPAPSDLSPSSASGEGSRTLCRAKRGRAFDWYSALNGSTDGRTPERSFLPVLLNALRSMARMLQAVVRDITERKRAEEALYENDCYRDSWTTAWRSASTCDSRNLCR
jgi:hypothetical protein